MLTDAKARQILPSQRPLADGSITGLSLHPSTNRGGDGKWILRFVSPVTCKRRDFGLGAYPATSVALARRNGMEARNLIGEGGDPIEAHRIAETEIRAMAHDLLFRSVAIAVHEELCAGFSNPKHAAQWITTLESYVFPKIGNRRVSDLRAADFDDALRHIWLTKPETA